MTRWARSTHAPPELSEPAITSTLPCTISTASTHLQGGMGNVGGFRGHALGYLFESQDFTSSVQHAECGDVLWLSGGFQDIRPSPPRNLDLEVREKSSRNRPIIKYLLLISEVTIREVYNMSFL